jgi:hypothetical protein
MLIFDDSFSGLSNLLKDLFFERIVSQKPSKVAYLSAIDDNNRISRLVFFVDWDFSDLFNDLHSINDLPKHNMLPVQVRTGFEGNEKL